MPQTETAKEHIAEALEDMAEFIDEELEDLLGAPHETRGGEVCFTCPPENLRAVLTFLRDNRECQFQMLIDVFGVDHPDRPARFEIIYNLLSIRQNARVRVYVNIQEDVPVPSVHDIFSSALWYEREVWDMFGAIFSGNPDLRRILTDYGFDGHPLRKDFPLTGRVEVRYDQAQKRVVYEPVRLVQDFRRFDNLSPWEGMTDVQIPGDEKAVRQTVMPSGERGDVGNREEDRRDKNKEEGAGDE